MALGPTHHQELAVRQPSNNVTEEDDATGHGDNQIDDNDLCMCPIPLYNVTALTISVFK